jgi:hypothetical protein
VRYPKPPVHAGRVFIALSYLAQSEDRIFLLEREAILGPGTIMNSAR